MGDFKSTLLTLADDAFFELIRNYLGPIKTPFNKHDLISQLLSFIRREEIQDRIISLIDNEDAMILSSIWILNDPSHEDLFVFLEPDMGFLDLHNKLLNLEDRLLIFRDGDLVRLNPEFTPRLTNGIVHPSRLFKAEPVGQASETRPWIDDSLLIALFGLIMSEPELYKGDGGLRKRGRDLVSSRIPALLEVVPSGEESGKMRIDILIDALTGLGLIVENRPRVRPVVHAWARWARINADERIAELAGAAATGGTGERSDTVLASLAVTLSLPPAVAMRPEGIARLASAATGVPAKSAASAVRSLHHFGVLASAGDGYCLAQPVEVSGSPSPPIVVGANFEVTLPADVSFPDGLFVAEVCQLVRHDTYSRFELTKERVARALRSGIGGSHIAERLAQLAGGEIPQNVTTSIKSWEDEYRSVRLHRGVVLEVHAGRRHAVDHSERIQNLIQEELAPGLYLLDEQDVPEVQTALREAGVELVPELPASEPPGYVSWTETKPDTSTETRISRVAEMIQDTVGRVVPELAGDNSLGISLQNALSEKRIAPEQRQELKHRIDRKLILSENQLRSGALKAEKTEAKGIDYAGKVRIIEQSLSIGGYLEVIERTTEGDPERRLVEPQALRKTGTELNLEALELPSRKAIVLPVSKLGLVRRLRAALFTRKPGD